MLGPIAASVFSRYRSVTESSLLCSFLSLISLIISFGSMKNIKKWENLTEKNDSKPRKKTILSFHKCVKGIFFAKFFVSLASCIFYSMLSIFFVNRYELSPAETGLIYGGLGVVGVASQIFYNYLEIKSSETLLLISSVFVALSHLLSDSTYFPYFIVSLLLYIASGSIMLTSSFGLLTRFSYKDNGVVIGMDMGIHNLRTCLI